MSASTSIEWSCAFQDNATGSQTWVAPLGAGLIVRHFNSRLGAECMVFVPQSAPPINTAVKWKLLAAIAANERLRIRLESRLGINAGLETLTLRDLLREALDILTEASDDL